MRLSHILGALGVAVCLATTVAPVTAEANSTSPYSRMEKMKMHSMMRHHRMMHHHHRMMHRHHRMMMK